MCAGPVRRMAGVHHAHSIQSKGSLKGDAEVSACARRALLSSSSRAHFDPAVVLTSNPIRDAARAETRSISVASLSPRSDSPPDLSRELPVGGAMAGAMTASVAAVRFGERGSPGAGGASAAASISAVEGTDSPDLDVINPIVIGLVHRLREKHPEFASFRVGDTIPKEVAEDFKGDKDFKALLALLDVDLDALRGVDRTEGEGRVRHTILSRLGQVRRAVVGETTENAREIFRATVAGIVSAIIIAAILV